MARKTAELSREGHGDMKLVGGGISLCGLLYIDDLPKPLIGFSTYTGVG